MTTRSEVATLARRMLAALVLPALLFAGQAHANQQITQEQLPGAAIPRFVDPLPVFAGERVEGPAVLARMVEFQQPILPASVYAGLPLPYRNGTFVWGYQLNLKPPHFPSFTIEARQGVPTYVLYSNELTGPRGDPPFLQKYLTVDQTLHWADPFGLVCMFDSSDPQCFTPYGYPSWPGFPLPHPRPPGAPVPLVTHLHGGETPPAFDGTPDQWFTWNGLQGPAYSTLLPVGASRALYRYPNSGEPTTLWFHDHALGTTRLNVFAGLSGAYLLRDHRDTGRADNPIGLPAGRYEVEALIQDRMFDTNGQPFFPDQGVNPTVHPFWIPEFFGDVITVNGKSWPVLEVEPCRYRLRFVNISNARFYEVSLSDAATGTQPGPTLWVIGTDGGLLDAPAPIVPPDLLTIPPAVRSDVVVDFSTVPAGSTWTLRNFARAPFPDGDEVDPATTGQVMQFRVVKPLRSADRTCDPRPAAANPCRLRARPIVRLADPATGALAPGVVPDVTRQLILVENESEDVDEPLEVLLNNTHWHGIEESTFRTTRTPIPDSTRIGAEFVTELPRVGSTEVWEVANLTDDAHPIHVHLVQFQLQNRQDFRRDDYRAAWDASFPSRAYQPGDGPPLPYGAVNADGAVGGNLAFTPYLSGPVLPPAPEEAGWKDTIIMPPQQITRIVLRWAPQRVPVGGVRPGQNLYPFDPTLTDPDLRDFAGNPGAPGYVWHCHILDHEDNEMMRPYAVLR